MYSPEPQTFQARSRSRLASRQDRSGCVLPTQLGQFIMIFGKERSTSQQGSTGGTPIAGAHKGGCGRALLNPTTTSRALHQLRSIYA